MVSKSHGGSVMTFDRARDALKSIPADLPRDEWVRAGMAAQAAGLDFDTFDNWSAEAGNYDAAAARDTWKSFKPGKGVGAGTLFKLAAENGWRMGADKPQRQAPAKALTRTVEPPRKPVPGMAAADVWERCEAATNEHGYIVDKRATGVPLDALRVLPAGDALTIQGESMAGALVVPVMRTDGTLSSLQFITPPDVAARLKAKGKPGKLNLPDCPVQGWFTVGELVPGGVVYIVEGIGQAWACWQATGAAAVVCFGWGRVRAVAAELRQRDASARLVVVPDRGKEAQAAEIARAVNDAWCELPQDKPANYDANDYAIERGVDALATLLERTKTPPMRFQVLSGADLCNAPLMGWMVRGVLPLEGLAALYGPSGSGKSFLVLDLAASIAGGAHDWFRRRVTQCPVTYCALEGEQGIGKRVYAWSLRHKKPVPDTLRFIAQPLDLLDGGDVSDLAKAVQAAGGAGGLVILDTLNRAAPGADENSSVDMGRIIAAAKQLQNLTGGLVLLVHHTGKDATKGLRGHSSLYAALDGAIEVNKTDTRREWSVAKSKDDETGTVHAFTLDIVNVGHDDEGEEVTSCVAVPDDSVEAVKRVKLPLGGNQKIALNTLADPLRNSKEFSKDGAPQGHPCIRLDEAVCIVAERMSCEAKRKPERARTAVGALVSRGIYGLKGDWLWRV